MRHMFSNVFLNAELESEVEVGGQTAKIGEN